MIIKTKTILMIMITVMINDNNDNHFKKSGALYTSNY